jgi:transcription-repair coupling factor (superfamily II helicase)
MQNLIPNSPGHRVISGTPAGMDARIVARAAIDHGAVMFVARDDVGLAAMIDMLAFFAPELEVLEFPAWDCLPYDRVSPKSDLLSKRIDTLGRLLETNENDHYAVVTTVSALLQRVPARATFSNAKMQAITGKALDPNELCAFLDRNGYGRVETVMEPGEYAIRGGIIDVFPSGAAVPVRLDFFGDELDGIRQFDPASQRSLSDDDTTISSMTFKPVSEVVLTEDTISKFRSQYRVQFGESGADDPLYEAVSASHRHIGMEHWLPFFYDDLETLFDYLPDALIFFDHQIDEAREARLDLIAEYFSARASFTGDTGGAPYRPVPPERLYLDDEEWMTRSKPYACATFSPFTAPENQIDTFDAGGHGGRDFADVRVQKDVSVFDAVRDHVASTIKSKRRVVIGAYSTGTRDRLQGLFAEHGLIDSWQAETWQQVEQGRADCPAIVILHLERGFVADDLCLITEQDILGDRLNRQAHRKVRAENFIAEASSLSEGDLVVHMEHGIGQFDGLETISVGGAPHDCLRLLYAAGSKLFLPVENIEVISKYGSEGAGANLDRLGGAAWQARKARMKERVRGMAEALIKTAAARELRKGPPIAVPDGSYDEFCARFAFDETEDQARAIEQTVEDLTSGYPVDRLICGDVGFGKTEVALRAAFMAAMNGNQVAIVVPTTLLARQHYRNFKDRFRGFPVRIEQLSRLVTTKQAGETKKGMADGQVDIVIGTHALLAKDVKFKDLGLLVIDEEQHFGVAHKERLKQFKANVHVLTLTATPIPRTLQLALSGIREMSLIATPPVDRLAVRTFIMPYDAVIIREAILRERFRGGQVFYVCPRVADLAGVEEQLKELVPDAKIAVAHGRLSATDLEKTIGDFYDGSYDILLSTNIVESGLDLPSVNTIILHRADMFGLAQLYQLRGRVGRSKTRAYAYLTLPPKRKLTKTAEKRLEVMQTLDTLGAGFSLASHDLDIRGAGNLLGDEQTGHIREVGTELYQQMLEEAVAEARGLDGADIADDEWSPQIAIGVPVLIPESYVSDLTVRMGLYRRLAWLTSAQEIEGFAAEMIDRFGSLPDEVENLLKTVKLKNICKHAGIEKVDAGPKGAVVSFRNSNFSNPAGLVEFLTSQNGTAKLRPDHKLVFMRKWDTPDDRFDGVQYLAGELESIAVG